MFPIQTYATSINNVQKAFKQPTLWEAHSVAVRFKCSRRILWTRDFHGNHFTISKSAQTHTRMYTIHVQTVLAILIYASGSMRVQSSEHSTTCSFNVYSQCRFHHDQRELSFVELDDFRFLPNTIFVHIWCV